jgi:hypothetical protein
MSTSRITAEAAAKIVVRHIRSTAPSSCFGIAEALHWSQHKAKTAISTAREMGLLTRVGKDEFSRFVFGAVQTPDWPGQS